MFGLIEARGLAVGSAIIIAIVTAGCGLTRLSEPIEGKTFDVELKAESKAAIEAVGLKAGMLRITLIESGKKLQITTPAGLEVDLIELSPKALRSLVVTSNKYSDEFPHHMNLFIDGASVRKKYNLRIAISKQVLESRSFTETRSCSDSEATRDKYRDDIGIFEITATVMNAGVEHDSTVIGEIKGDTEAWHNVYKTLSGACF